VAHLSSNALNVSGAVLGGTWVEEMARKKIPAAKTYKLSWGYPRWTDGTVKVRFSCDHKTARYPTICPTNRENQPALPQNHRSRKPQRPCRRRILLPPQQPPLRFTGVHPQVTEVPLWFTVAGYSSNALAGSGAVLGGGKAMARKKLAAFIPYKLSWTCPRWTGRGENAGDSPRCAFSVSSWRRKKRKPAPSAEKTAR
jgi:hypothetical protein